MPEIYANGFAEAIRQGRGPIPAALAEAYGKLARTRSDSARLSTLTSGRDAMSSNTERRIDMSSAPVGLLVPRTVTNAANASQKKPKPSVWVFCKAVRRISRVSRSILNSLLAVKGDASQNNDSPVRERDHHA